MEFLRAKLEDADSIAALVNAAYRGDSSREGWTTEADILGGQRTDGETVREMILRQNGYILKDAQLPLRACVYLEKRGDTCYLGMLTVNPSLQAAGLGSKLLKAAERFAAERMACSRIEMTVISQRQELIAWYERRGYQKTGKEEAFPYGNPRFGEPKVEGLVFVVFEKAITKIA